MGSVHVLTMRDHWRIEDFVASSWRWIASGRCDRDWLAKCATKYVNKPVTARDIDGAMEIVGLEFPDPPLPLCSENRQPEVSNGELQSDIMRLAREVVKQNLSLGIDCSPTLLTLAGEEEEDGELGY